MFTFWQKILPSNLLKRRNLRIEDIITPLIVLASLTGLLPHSIKFSKSKNVFKIIPFSIYLNFLCSLTIIVLLFTFGIIHVIYMFGTAEKSQFNSEVTTQLNYIMEVIIFDIFCLLTFVFAFFYRSRFVNIFNMIISTWTSIPPTKRTQIILKKLRFRRNIALLCLIGTFIVQMSVNLSRQEGPWKKLLVGFSFNMPQIIQFILHAHYMMLVLTVAAILENINSQCQLLAHGEFASYPFIEIKPKIKRMSLRQMELIYMKVFDIKTEINRAFEGPMLASIMQCFHALISESHILYHGVIVDKRITTHEVFNCSSWIIYQFIKIYSLAVSGSLLKREALKTAQILHCVPTERQDVLWYMEVQHFSTLLKYQSVEINIYGFFPVDATLMFNMIASATMYLIILVQFDNND